MRRSATRNRPVAALIAVAAAGVWLSVIATGNACALDLERAKAFFLAGDYSGCITEGEKLLASSGHSKEADELYYLLGLSYLKEGNFLRASDIFEIIIGEFKGSRYREEAYLGLGDAYFLKGDYAKAEKSYQELLAKHPKTAWKGLAYHRLSQCAFKEGDAKRGEEYLCKVKNDFAMNLEVRNQTDIACPIVFHTVQVGSFASRQNAANLVAKLIQEGFPAYIENLTADGQVRYRVRVGKCKVREDAVQLGEKLTQRGYPTKLYP